MADREAEAITTPKAEEAPPVLTVAGLRDLIRAHALQGSKGNPTRLRMPNDEMPNDEVLAELASIVNHWAGVVCQAQVDAAKNAAAREAGDAAATLRAALPIIGNRLVAQTDQGNPIAAQEFLAVRRLYEAARSFVPPAPTIWRAEGVRDNPVPTWRHFAGALFADLERLFGRRLGLHDAGPAAKLLAALLSRVTADEITPARIGEVLRSKK